MNARHGGLLVSCLLVFTGGAAASSLTVEPDSLDLDLAAGSDVTRELGVSYTGDTAVVTEINYSVTAESTDTEGLAVSVSPNRFILDPGETRTVDFRVESNHTLKPDNFTVRLNAVTEVETAAVDAGGDDGDDDGDLGGGGVDIGFGDDDSQTGNGGKGEQGGESPNRTGNEEDGSNPSSDRAEELRNRVEELRNQLEEERQRQNDSNQTNRGGGGPAQPRGPRTVDIPAATVLTVIGSVIATAVPVLFGLII